MKDAGEITVVIPNEKAWERQELVPITSPIPINEWLDIVHSRGMRVLAPPFSRIVEGLYEGGHVIALDDAAGRSWFAVPREAVPLLREHMDPAEYEELVGRTP